MAAKSALTFLLLEILYSEKLSSLRAEENLAFDGKITLADLVKPKLGPNGASGNDANCPPFPLRKGELTLMLMGAKATLLDGVDDAGMNVCEYVREMVFLWLFSEGGSKARMQSVGGDGNVTRCLC